MVSPVIVRFSTETKSNGILFNPNSLSASLGIALLISGATGGFVFTKFTGPITGLKSPICIALESSRTA